MAKEPLTADADKALEAGVFYPRHCIMLGLDGDQVAEALKALREAGFSEADCQRIDASRFLQDAQHNVDDAGLFASLGKSLHVRYKQLELARAGVEFIVVRAPTGQDTERVVKALKTLPVRYAIKYETLVIEDLIQFFRSTPAGTHKEHAV